MKKITLVLVLVLSILTLGMKSVSITSIVEHPALDAVREGVLETLKTEGFIEGETIEVTYQNAQGSMTTAAAIARQFVLSKTDVIVAIATPVAQAAVNATTEIPIVFSAVTDPVGAGLIPALGSNAGNVVGISDMTPVFTQLKLLKLVMPYVKKVGVIYNPSEANSVVLTDFAKDAAAQLGFEILEITGSTTSEMITSLNAMIGDIDALYIGTDNTAASSAEGLGTIAERNKVPIIAGEIGIARGGAIIGFGFDYYKIGLETGKLVAAILNGEKTENLSSGLLGAEALVFYVNKDLADKIGVDLPENIIERADILVEDGQEN